MCELMESVFPMKRNAKDARMFTLPAMAQFATMAARGNGYFEIP